LDALVKSEVWRLDLLPVLEQWAQASVDLMTADRTDAIARAEASGTYKAVTQLVHHIAGAREMGRTAYRRLVVRRLGEDAVLPSRGRPR
jgi:hypothetical protein